MTVKQLIKELQKESGNCKVLIASDEEWNALYKKIQIDTDEDGNLVIFGLSGSEKLETYEK